MYMTRYIISCYVVAHVVCVLHAFLPISFGLQQEYFMVRIRLEPYTVYIDMQYYKQCGWNFLYLSNCCKIYNLDRKQEMNIIKIL